MARLRKYEQDSIVNELLGNPAQWSEEEFKEKYDQLDAKHQAEVDEGITQYANDAVGSDDWDQD